LDGRVVSVLPVDHQVPEQFSEAQFEDLLTVMPRHFWFAARARLIAWAVQRYFPRAQSLLDVGCGTGAVLQMLQDRVPGLRLTGAEASLEALRVLASRAPGIDAVRADTRGLPYRDEFDVVGAFDVLEHIPDDGLAMRALAGAAVPGGGVIVTVPQHPSLWTPIDDYAGHQRRYTRHELVARAREAGLDVVHVTSFVSLLLPALWLSRLLQRNQPVDPMQEFRVSETVNAVGGAVMAVERRLIEAGVSMPAGGSLLLVARRRA
jgi:SAM-dependent methyltransferase